MIDDAGPRLYGGPELGIAAGRPNSATTTRLAEELGYAPTGKGGRYSFVREDLLAVALLEEFDLPSDFERPVEWLALIRDALHDRPTFVLVVPRRDRDWHVEPLDDDESTIRSLDEATTVRIVNVRALEQKLEELLPC